MDLEYLKCQICDELDGAKDYAIKAIELKPMAISWAKMLIDMAVAELGHAANLYKMFVEYYQKIAGAFTETPSHVEDLHREVVRCYAERSANIKTIIDMYSK